MEVCKLSSKKGSKKCYEQYKARMLLPISTWVAGSPSCIGTNYLLTWVIHVPLWIKSVSTSTETDAKRSLSIRILSHQMCTSLAVVAMQCS